MVGKCTRTAMAAAAAAAQRCTGSSSPICNVCMLYHKQAACANLTAPLHHSSSSEASSQAPLLGNQGVQLLGMLLHQVLHIHLVSLWTGSGRWVGSVRLLSPGAGGRAAGFAACELG